MDEPRQMPPPPVIATGFFGSDHDTYYVSPSGRAWHVQSVDGGPTREVDRLPMDLRPLPARLCTDIDLPPDALAPCLGQVVEVLLEGNVWGRLREVTAVGTDVAGAPVFWIGDPALTVALNVEDHGVLWRWPLARG